MKEFLDNRDRRANRLINEKSPYLLQHAYNPVDWFPWSEEAFAKAKRENKPIFLSIGYSTCHWCHVMERESFEDEEVAELLNRHFVSIKVDREERPDIDHIYMTVCQAMTGQGGWPLTIIMTPDQKPFFAGTYFPKTRRFGRVGLMDILDEIAKKWAEKHDSIADYGDYIAREVQKHTLANLKGEMTETILDDAFALYEQTFDFRYGGFGRAPKFPTSHNLSFLLRYYLRTKNEKALQMVEKTLEGMHRGGMYDHIGFGFSRYSTDERWLVPHFEKMLYDNALLAMTYLEAYQVTGKRQYADVAQQVFTYVLRDMTDPEGGFYSAEDADSEGEEGKFYVWTPDEVKEVLGEEEGERFCQWFDITREGNFEGRSIPNLIQRDLASIAQREKMPLDHLQKRVSTLRQKLFEAREQRVHPHKDDKILTSWNGLMIMAMAKGAKALGNERYLAAAKRAEEFIRNRLIREDGRILARYRDGEAAHLGYIDDYAFYVWALIELYEASLDARYLKDAMRHTDEMIRLFWDKEEGGFFFYGSDGEELIARPKEIYDGAVPSGNSVAALNLLRLAHMTGREDYRKMAEEIFRAFAGSVSRYPSGHAMLLTALDFAYGNVKEIVIAGDSEHEEIQKAIRLLHVSFLPQSVYLYHPGRDEGDMIRQISSVVRDKGAVDGKPAFYVCENFSCQAPVFEAKQLGQRLGVDNPVHEKYGRWQKSYKGKKEK